MMFNVFGREAVSRRDVVTSFCQAEDLNLIQGSTRRSVQAVGITYVRRSSIGGLERPAIRSATRWASERHSLGA
jgi:hypothetical protein